MDSLDFGPRYAYAQVRKNAGTYFCKIALDTALNPFLENALLWSQAIQQAESLRKCRIPHVVETFVGDEELLYQVSENIAEFKPLATKKFNGIKPDCGELATYLPRIVRTYFEMQNLLRVPAVQANLQRQDLSAARQNLLEKTKSWYTPKVRQHFNLDDFLDILSTLPEPFAIGFNHGDFVPWHFGLDSKTDLYLIDAEKASLYPFLYYDLAYMYTRIYTRLNSPNLARTLLRQVEEYLPTNEERQKFRGSCKILLASRIIGEMYDAIELDNLQDLSLHRQLLSTYRSNKLFG